MKLIFQLGPHQIYVSKIYVRTVSYTFFYTHELSTKCLVFFAHNRVKKLRYTRSRKFFFSFDQINLKISDQTKKIFLRPLVDRNFFTRLSRKKCLYMYTVYIFGEALTKKISFTCGKTRLKCGFQIHGPSVTILMTICDYL